MINNPHALYYNGELIGIITNPDPVPGGISAIVQGVDPTCDEKSDAVTIPRNMGNLEQWADFANAVVALEVAETIEPTNPGD